MEVKCELCFSIVKRKTDLARHKKSENCKKISNIINNIINEKENIYNKTKKENIEYINEIVLLKKEIEDKDKQIKLLQEKSEEYRKIVEKAATKSTFNNNNNYTHNNYLNYISSEPLKFKEIKEQAKKYINSVSVMYDDEDFHDHIVDNILKDKNGKDKVLCTDINRKNFTYKDENSGKMIYDPELERLREELKKGTDIKQIRSQLLEKLVAEYEENGGVGIDPFKQFSDMIKKLNFGNPFIDHVAKKTYVKRCSNNDSSICSSIENKCKDEGVSSQLEDSVLRTELSDANRILDDNIHESLYISSREKYVFEEEDEYQKLLAEFGDSVNL